MTPFVPFPGYHVKICHKTRKHSSRMHTDRAVTRKSSELVAMRPIVDNQTNVKKITFPLRSVITDEIIIQILQLQQNMFNLEDGVFGQKTCGTQPLDRENRRAFWRFSAFCLCPRLTSFVSWESCLHAGMQWMSYMKHIFGIGSVLVTGE